MVTLSLFRHAKSAWNIPDLGDFDRPLAPRGEKAAQRMGRYMAAHGIQPECIYCSGAARARQTLQLALPELGYEPDIQYTGSLYHAGAGLMLDLVRTMPDACAHAMLVGHNPGVHALALDLAGGGPAEAIEGLARKFPTAGLAVIEFAGNWGDVAPAAGTLTYFMTPRLLP